MAKIESIVYKYGFYIFGVVMFLFFLGFLRMKHNDVAPKTPPLPVQIEYVDSTICPHCGSFVPINAQINRLMNVKNDSTTTTRKAN